MKSHSINEGVEKEVNTDIAQINKKKIWETPTLQEISFRETETGKGGTPEVDVGGIPFGGSAS